MVAANEKGMGAGGDVRDWDMEGYRTTILQERDLQCRTIFRVVFAPLTTPSSTPDILVAAASDGSIAGYSISSCTRSSQLSPRTRTHHPYRPCVSTDDSVFFAKGHKGPAYDVKFFGDGEDALLLSCGDDGRICGWKWKDILDFKLPVPTTGIGPSPILDLLNPQERGPWNSLSAIPENNAIDVNTQDGSIFSAAGDACAYCWDVETSKRKLVFRGHTDYLHCIAALKSSNQVITGSEDGTTRIWDCKSGKCTQVIHPGKDHRSKKSTWISCVAVDASESWLVTGTGKNLSVWSLPSCECIWNIGTRVPVQDVHFDRNQILAVGSEPILTRFGINGKILSQIHCAPQSGFSISSHPNGVTAVGGYGGLIDVISEYGSHLCTFSCQGQ